ncbi:hypothetical protein [Maribellus sp. YY47]|uniref:hypothetical protein n=1 Tax=Maribellus sp. YY47 TaxID=2929486 RepID=UPI002000E984|nr:hypothetical protein [Maribellus sp. YY47]MCK3685530.1 hypothetical protein [Maribellus sp. YY47]
MKNVMKYLMVVWVTLIGGWSASAQWNSGYVNVRFSLPEIALVDIEPDLGNVEFAIAAPGVAGGEPVVEHVSNETVWINYTSAILKNGSRRSINAQISEGSIPDGISLYIQASVASAFGSENQGSPVGKVQITSQPHPVISGIGSCFTGDGIGKGHEIQYFLEISDFEQIKSIGEQVFTVMYTITDN